MVPRILTLLSIVCSMCVFVGESAATAPRTFVASNGSDANPCSIAQPCRGFARAITQTSVGGEVIVLDSAGYGTVTISQSVSIIAPAGTYAGITVASGDGVTVNGPGATVVLRGLSITGQGGSNGIIMLQPGRLQIESCVISGMGAVGIYHQASGGEMIILDTIVRNNVDGIGLVAPNGSIMLDRVHSEHNQNTGFYIAPTPGSTKVSATIVDSVFAYNGANGVWADTVGGAITNIHVERSVMSNNGNDGFRATSAAGGSKAYVILTRNAVDHNGGNAILMDGEAAGVAQGQIAENAVIGNGGSGIYAAGAHTGFNISANSLYANGGIDLNCVTGSHIFSLGNNLTQSTIGGNPCYFNNAGGH
jgi:hypothetical protein